MCFAHSCGSERINVGQISFSHFFFCRHCCSSWTHQSGRSRASLSVGRVREGELEVGRPSGPELARTDDVWGDQSAAPRIGADQAPGGPGAAPPDAGSHGEALADSVADAEGCWRRRHRICMHKMAPPAVWAQRWCRRWPRLQPPQRRGAVRKRQKALACWGVAPPAGWASGRWRRPFRPATFPPGTAANLRGVGGGHRAQGVKKPFIIWNRNDADACLQVVT